MAPATGQPDDADDTVDLTDPTITIGPESHLTAAAEQMVGHEVATLLVVGDGDGDLVGTLGYLDVMRALRPGRFDIEQDGWLRDLRDRRRARRSTRR